jgi:alpha-beta hydrolase superfamily lysophospholipase
MRAEEFDLEVDDGTRLHVRRWSPEHPPRAVVQITHGMAEHSGRYTRLAGVRVGAGYGVWAHDHRGHGRTAATADDLGLFAAEDGFDHLVADLLAVRAALGRTEPDGAARPVALFAHSMGSFVAQSALALHPPSPWDAVILAGSDTPAGRGLGAFTRVARVEQARTGPRGRSALLDRLAFGPYNAAFRPTRTGSDWLTRDTDQVDAYLADPLNGFRFTNRAWLDFMGGRARVARSGFAAVSPPDLPVLLLGGEQDPVGRNGRGVAALGADLRRAGLRNVTVRLYPGARHELVNETNHADVDADILAFLARTLGPPTPDPE